MKQTTLCYPMRDGHVLLAMKKRGFGEGMWNGSGGKLHAHERPEDACRREVIEEIGIAPQSLMHRGKIQFIYLDKPEWDNECHLYITEDFIGEPVESEEMKPAWFSVDDIPLQQMWEDDSIWLMDLLRGKSIQATCYFLDGKVIRWLEHDV